MRPVYQLAGALAASETRYIALGLAAASVSAIVDNSTNVTVSITNSDTVGASSLWSVLTLTSNGASMAGPITGFKLVANASGGSFSILATHKL